jgi:acetylornithine deacetylase/succinyl-diaminopimelate desuccinylase-like protein
MPGPADKANRPGAGILSLPPGIESLDWLAALPAAREALRFMSRERKWIDDRHLDICRIPAPTFFEQKRAEWLLGQLREWGWEARIDRAGNVLATQPAAPASKDAPLVAVTAHLDTVLAPRSPEEIKVAGNERFIGPGVADNGAGLAALMALARAFPPPGALEFPAAALLLAATVGEEGDGNLSGMRFLCQNSPWAPRIRSFLVLDGPATSHVTSRALACRRFEITVSGPGGHSWSDHGAANPVHALSRAITWFGDQRAQSPDGQPRHSFNFGVVDGGSTVNAIPSSARARVDLRSESAGHLDALAAGLSEVLERALLAENERSAAGRVTARLKETGSRPGGRLPPDSPLLQHIAAVDAWLGIRSAPDCASTDANIPLSMGLPAISIGAGGLGGGAHTPGEWYSPEGRDLGLRRVLLATCLMLAEAAGAAEAG